MPVAVAPELIEQAKGGDHHAFRKIVEAHQGRIRVESELGKGTTFTLKLVRSESPAGFVDTSAA